MIAREHDAPAFEQGNPNCRLQRLGSLVNNKSMVFLPVEHAVRSSGKRTCYHPRRIEEFMAMCMVANTYNLNPILKEIYAFPGKGGNVMPIVGVDGWIKLMNSNPAFDGIDFEEGEDFCTATIYRKDRAHPIKATEWLAECMGTTEPWKRWPRRMLRHKAMVQCARIAFGFAGIYDEDEARRIASVGEMVDAATARPEATRKTSASPLREALHVEAHEAHEAAAAPAPATAEAEGADAVDPDIVAVM